MVKPSGALCRKIARKISQPEPVRDHETGTDGHAVEERVHAEAAEHRVAGVHGDEFVVMRLFAVVEVGVDGVLQQMDHAVAGHDEDGPQAGAQLEALRHHLEHRYGHEEAGAEGDEVAQVALDAAGAHQNQAAGDVGERGQQAQQDGELSIV